MLKTKVFTVFIGGLNNIDLGKAGEKALKWARIDIIDFYWFNLRLGMGVFKTGFTQTDKFNESMQGLARFTFM